jgi:hypothetical protein
MTLPTSGPCSAGPLTPNSLTGSSTLAQDIVAPSSSRQMSVHALIARSWISLPISCRSGLSLNSLIATASGFSRHSPSRQPKRGSPNPPVCAPFVPESGALLTSLNYTSRTRAGRNLLIFIRPGGVKRRACPKFASLVVSLTLRKTSGLHPAKRNVRDTYGSTGGVDGYQRFE